MEVYAVIRVAGYMQETHGLYVTEAKAKCICALLQELEAETIYYVVGMEVVDDIREEAKALQECIEEWEEEPME